MAVRRRWPWPARRVPHARAGAGRLAPARARSAPHQDAWPGGCARSQRSGEIRRRAWSGAVGPPVGADVVDDAGQGVRRRPVAVHDGERLAVVAADADLDPAPWPSPSSITRATSRPRTSPTTSPCSATTSQPTQVSSGRPGAFGARRSPGRGEGLGLDRVEVAVLHPPGGGRGGEQAAPAGPGGRRSPRRGRASCCDVVALAPRQRPGRGRAPGCASIRTRRGGRGGPRPHRGTSSARRRPGRGDRERAPRA